MKKAGIPLSSIPTSMGGTYADKSIERCIDELLAEGGIFRGGGDEEYTPQTEENIVEKLPKEGEVVSLTREPSLPGEEAEAETLSPSMKILGVEYRPRCGDGFGGAVASAGRSSRHRIRPFVDGRIRYKH